MGFDIHGMDPVMRQPDPDKYPTYEKYHDMEWGKRQELFDKEDNLENQFYQEMRDRENENPGVYFRNNVWWWRPLWVYVCGECEDILDPEDYEGGSSNDGHEISADKAVLIAKRLYELIDSGDAKGFEDYHKKKMKEAEENNARAEKEDGKKYGDNWDWSDSYPFAVDNVRAFADFCAESGGFEIC